MCAGHDRDLPARDQAILLQGIIIHNVVDLAGSQPAKINDRGSLGGSAVSGDRFSLGLEFRDHAVEGCFKSHNSGREILINFRLKAALFFLFPEKSCHDRHPRSRASFFLYKNP